MSLPFEEARATVLVTARHYGAVAAAHAIHKGATPGSIEELLSLEGALKAAAVGYHEAVEEAMLSYAAMREHARKLELELDLVRHNLTEKMNELTKKDAELDMLRRYGPNVDNREPT